MQHLEDLFQLLIVLIEPPLARQTTGQHGLFKSGVGVAGPNSGFGDQAYLVQAGAGLMVFSPDSLPLQPGTFLVSTAAVDRGHTYDFRDRTFELRVRADEAVTEPGLVRMTGSWTRMGNVGPAISTAEESS